MFKGTDKLAPGELSKTVTANGGSDNAFTHWDFTAYFQRISSDRLPLVMQMEADRMANLRISEDDWQAERQVVLEERAERVDSNVFARFIEELTALRYDNHPYGRPIIGWRDEVDALTRDDAIAWYDQHYAPNAAILVIAGDVTPEEARALAEENYGSIPAKADIQPRQRPTEPVRTSARRLEMSDPQVPQPYMVRNNIAPARNPGDQKQAAALTVLAAMLGGSSQTSFLAQELTLPGTTLWAGADYDGFALDNSEFTLSLYPGDGVTPEQAEAALDAALEKFLSVGPSPDALERVKIQIRAGEVYKQDSAHGRAYDYGQGLATGLTSEDIAEWPALLDAGTVEDVAQAANMVLTPKGSVTGWLLPAEAPAENLTAPAVEQEAEVQE